MCFIVFEGTDKAGKSSLSVEFQKYLNTEYSDHKGSVTIDPQLGPFVWTKEPSFTSDEADRLNSKETNNQYKREALFFESRMGHQEFLRTHNIVCDRYVWSGMAYARVFSPGCYEFSRELYRNKNLFLQPDLYIYVNAHIDTCLKRDPSLNRDTLLEIWKSFEICYDDMEEMGIPIITLNNDDHSNDPVVSMQISLDKLKADFSAHLKLVGKA